MKKRSWKVLKNRLAKEGYELVTICNQLKMPGVDGKLYKTDTKQNEKNKDVKNKQIKKDIIL